MNSFQMRTKLVRDSAVSITCLLTRCMACYSFLATENLTRPVPSIHIVQLSCAEYIAFAVRHKRVDLQLLVATLAPGLTRTERNTCFFPIADPPLDAYRTRNSHP